jgi:hypothetical protein
LHSKLRSFIVRSRFALLILALLSLLFFRIPRPGSLLRDEILNLGHFPLFGLVAYLLLAAQTGRRSRSKDLLLSFVGTVALAAVAELGQGLVGRNVELKDFLHGVLGVAVLLGGVYAYRQRRPLLVGVHAAFAVASLTLVLVPVARLVLAAPKFARAFPHLASFEASWELAHWQPMSCAKLARSQTVSTQGGWSLEVACPPCSYPGAGLSDFPKDWSAYRALQFDTYVSDADTLRLYVRIDSQARGEARPHRFTRSFCLHPGWNQVIVPLDELARARGAPPRNVRLCLFFLRRPQQARTFSLDNIVLSDLTSQPNDKTAP